MSSYRIKYLDGDYRRDPKTEIFCCVCQKDIDPANAHLEVHLVDGGPFALHLEDEEAYKASGSPGDLGWFYIGSECAKKAEGGFVRITK